MATLTVKKASIQDNLDLAKKYWAKGTSPESALVDLKQKRYTVNSIRYNAVAVAQGVAMICDINIGITAGRLKATKAKGLAVVK